MTIESQNQILTPYDRLSRRLDNLFKVENQEQSPDTFDAYIFVDHLTEEVARTARNNVASSTDSEGILKCRVFDENFYHAGQDSPLDAKTAEEYKIAINGCSEGYVRGDHPNLSSLVNGSVWTCTMKGQTIQLLSLSRATSFYFNPKNGGVEGRPGGARDSLKGGRKEPVGDRISNGKIKVVYADPANMKQQVAQFSYYRVFLDTFVTKLGETAFSQNQVVVNSMYRSPKDQARAMARTRFFGTPSSYESFYAWFTSEYGSSSKAKEIGEVIKANKDVKTGAEMESAIEKKLIEQASRGVYISKHMVNGAFDFQTKNFSFEDVNLMLEVLAEMKNSIVSFYNWEGVWSYYIKDNPRASASERKAKGLSVRKSSGPISNEHIHLNVIKTTNPGE